MKEPFEQRFALLTLEEYKETLERLKRLEALCVRAADALDYQLEFINRHCCDGYPSASGLIAELRKAAE
jgi:hypothetical protein